MLSENEPKSARVENGPILILGVIFVAVILVTICALSAMLVNRQKDPRPTPQQDLPAIFIPTASLPTAMPANHFSVRLPIILSGSFSVPEQIWKVTEIKTLGYELDGHHYDAAIFTRVDSQDTVKA